MSQDENNSARRAAGNGIYPAKGAKNDPGSQKKYFGLIEEVPLELSVEVGRAYKTMREIVDYTSGSIIELDKQAGEPVNLYVNGQLIGHGEIVVVDENFGVRILDLIET